VNLGQGSQLRSIPLGIWPQVSSSVAPGVWKEDRGVNPMVLHSQGRAGPREWTVHSLSLPSHYRGFSQPGPRCPPCYRSPSHWEACWASFHWIGGAGAALPEDFYLLFSEAEKRDMKMRSIILTVDFISELSYIRNMREFIVIIPYMYNFDSLKMVEYLPLFIMKIVQ
jgi:hypothetical protein